jgi:Ca2+-binding EF-hand superfamily protein
MIKVVTGTLVALALIAGPALAQTTTPTTKPTTAAASGDAAVAAKFKGADKNGNGSLDGAELDSYKADLAKIDTDKDGKISLAEFTAANKSGVVK